MCSYADTPWDIHKYNGVYAHSYIHTYTQVSTLLHPHIHTYTHTFFQVKRQPTSNWPISNVPDIVTVNQTELEEACGKKGHAFMLVATYGFWDVVNNEKAAALVARQWTDAGLTDEDSNGRW